MIANDFDITDNDQNIKVNCYDLDVDGFGISRWNNKVLVTPGLLPYEQALVTIEFKKGSRYITRLIKILRSSDYRIKPKCLVHKDCGGCNIQHLEYTQMSILRVQSTCRLAPQPPSPPPFWPRRGLPSLQRL